MRPFSLRLCVSVTLRLISSLLQKLPRLVAVFTHYVDEVYSRRQVFNANRVFIPCFSNLNA